VLLFRGCQFNSSKPETLYLPHYFSELLQDNGFCDVGVSAKAITFKDILFVITRLRVRNSMRAYPLCAALGFVVYGDRIGDPVFAKGDSHGMGSVVGVQLLQDGGHVVLYR